MYILAMLSMLLDHVGIVFFPEEITYRIIGRLALPIYAFGIVQGFRHTSSFRRYVCRLLLLAAVSQIPFMLAVSDSEINIIGTFIICLVVLKLLGSMKNTAWKVLLIGGAALALELFPFEYGCYVLVLVLIFHYSKSEILMHLVLNALFLPIMPLQVFSVLGTALIKSGFYVGRVPRWMWRSFYPAHLTIIAVILYFYQR
ncbi:MULTISPECIES: TraX family protein [Brevibacillus]|uniref:TraX family protein n=1 Tax=Brevibacillus TaxID=55080 RepID=UPI0018CD96F0|nr:TraX family protein [Brevibacillus agri]MBG9568185.1 hypothetical protein [Brevibacillus agri]